MPRQDQVERHFPTEEIIPGVLKLSAKHFLCPLIPTGAFESSLDDSKRNMEEIADRYERSGKCTEGTRLSGISPQKKLF